jgi:hypothetical protein
MTFPAAWVEIEQPSAIEATAAPKKFLALSNRQSRVIIITICFDQCVQGLHNGPNLLKGAISILDVFVD